MTIAKNIVGKKFGKWKVISKSERGGLWLCRCKCGTEKEVKGSDLVNGYSTQCKKCGHSSLVKDISGKQFGDWSVLWRDGHKRWICRCKCGIEKSVSKETLFKDTDLTLMCRDCYHNAIIGKQFGKWTVLRRDSENSNRWVCRCECGFEKAVYKSHFKLGNSISCRKCSEQKHKGKLNSRILYRIQRGAKIRGLVVDLGRTTEEAKRFLYDLLYEKQGGRCALTGIAIGIANTIRGDWHGETTASLDRIDSKKGYTRDNVQWVHKWINFMKQDFDQKEFISLCEAVTKYQYALTQTTL